MDEQGIGETLDRQDGVISRRQLVAHGADDMFIRRRLRRRDWVSVHTGVYVNHTGPLTWQQRAWAAVLAVWPAALCHQSALRADDGPGRRTFDTSASIDVAIDRKRSLRITPDGVRVHHLSELDAKVRWNLSPPRVRAEQTVLDLAAAAASDFEAVALIADSVQSRRTTADRLQRALALRPRIARRDFLRRLLDDVAEGSCSVLEQGYLVRVERAHGLPQGRRQVRASLRGPVYRDVVYEQWQQVVELDGRLFHDRVRARDADLDRDLDAAAEGLGTVRLGWGQVFDRSCLTAARIGAVLQRRGWAGAPTTCPGCSK